jgi:aminotransferase
VLSGHSWSRLAEPDSSKNFLIAIKKDNDKMNNKSVISNRVSQIGKSAIHEMTRLSKEVEDAAFLSWAKPTSDTPEYIKETAIAAIKNGLAGGYSENSGLLELRKEIVKKLKRDNNIDANTSQIMVTVGAIEGLSAAVMALVDPGDEVILPTPTYSTHIRQVVISSGKPVLVPTIEEEGFIFDIEAIKKAITSRTKAILFCSPSNPTGTVFNEKQLRQLADIALENNLMVITDEAYEYFTYDGHKHFSIASIPEMRKNVISCFTFTKTYAMTGWRIGYLHADEEIIPQITKAHIPFAICAPVVSQYAALGALKGPQNCIVDFREHYLATRNLMCERLDALDSVFQYHKPEGSYLMFPKILLEEGKDSTTFCKDLLKKGGVSTTPGIAFGPTGQSHLRLSFCVPEDEINKAFDRMEDYFR